MPEAKTTRSITGRATTAGAPEETLNLSLDGAVAAATVAVAANTVLFMTDWTVTSLAAANFRLQETVDGVAFFDLALLRVPADGTVGTDWRVGLRIAGGATAALRVRVETPAGAAAVTTTIRTYTEA